MTITRITTKGQAAIEASILLLALALVISVIIFFGNVFLDDHERMRRLRIQTGVSALSSTDDCRVEETEAYELPEVSIYQTAIEEGKLLKLTEKVALPGMALNP